MFSRTPPLTHTVLDFFSKFKLIIKANNVFYGIIKFSTEKKPIIGRVDGAYAAEAVDLNSIPSRFKPKTIKIGIHSFPA